MTLFTAYISAQNLISQIYTQLGYGRLGQVCLFCVATGTVLTCLVAAHIVNIIPTKVILIGGAGAHVTLIAAGTLTTFCKTGTDGGICGFTFIFGLNVFSALCVGCGGALLWLRQSTYVNECADENTKGLFNGTFWSIFQTAQILGSTLAAFMLGRAEPSTFYCMLLVFGLSALVMLYFVQPPVPKNNQVITQETNMPKETLSEAVKKFVRLFGDQQYYFLFSALFLSGVAIGSYVNFLSAYVTITVDSDDLKIVNQCVGYALMVLAFGEVGAGLSMGKLADKYDKLKLFTITILLNEVALLLSLIAVVSKSYFIALLCALFFGYGDTAIQTMINAVIGSMFGGKAEVYSAYRFFQASGMVYAALLAVIIPRTSPILYIMAIAGTIMVFHLLYNRYLPRTGKKASDYSLLEEGKLMTELKKL